MFSSLGQSLPGLVAAYHFDGNARDIIGAHDGTPMMASAFAAPTTPIVSLNQSLVLGPGSGYVSAPDSPAFAFTTGFTLEAWVSLTDSNGCSSIAGKDWNRAFWIGFCGTTFGRRCERQPAERAVAPLASWLRSSNSTSL